VIHHIAESNSSFLATHHGIDVCGKRLAEEIELLRDKHKLPNGTFLTLMGMLKAPLHDSKLLLL
jgi:hypothetical protein